MWRLRHRRAIGKHIHALVAEASADASVHRPMEYLFVIVARVVAQTHGAHGGLFALDAQRNLRWRIDRRRRNAMDVLDRPVTVGNADVGGFGRAIEPAHGQLQRTGFITPHAECDAPSAPTFSTRSPSNTWLPRAVCPTTSAPCCTLSGTSVCRSEAPHTP